MRTMAPHGYRQSVQSAYRKSPVRAGYPDIGYHPDMIVYCCSDLIFATKIRSTAQTMGVETRPARDVDALRNRLDRVDDGKCNDAVTSVLIDMDLEDKALALLALVKQHSPSTPVVCFGSHVATELLQSARDGGADYVMSRGSFTGSLPQILQKFGTTK